MVSDSLLPGGSSSKTDVTFLQIPSTQIGLALLLLIVGLLLPLTWWLAWGVLFLFELVLLVRAKINYTFWLKRFPFFLVFMGLVAASLPLSQNFEHGTDRAWLILMRGTSAFLATVWLTQVLSPLDFLRVLRQARLPLFFIESLSFMLRYLALLTTERETLQKASRSRTFEKPSLISQWKMSAQIVTAVLVRALYRAERIYQAMKARNWKGQ